MNLFNQDKIQDLIDHGYRFDIGDYFNEGFEIVKKELGLFIGFTLVYLIIAIVASYIPFSSLLITPPLIAGFFIVAHKVHQNESIEFGDFFKGFDYFGQLVIQSLIMFVFMLVLAIPLFLIFGSAIYYIATGNIDAIDIGQIAGMGGLGFMLFILVFIGSIYLTISYIFAPFFIVFGDMQAWDAMEASRKVAAKNFFPILGLVFLVGLLNMGGALLCLVGLLFTIPAGYAIIYCAFKHVMDLDVEGPEHGEDILDHLVD